MLKQNKPLILVSTVLQWSLKVYTGVLYWCTVLVSAGFGGHQSGVSQLGGRKWYTMLPAHGAGLPHPGHMGTQPDHAGSDVILTCHAGSNVVHVHAIEVRAGGFRVFPEGLCRVRPRDQGLVEPRQGVCLVCVLEGRWRGPCGTKEWFH